MMTFYFWVLVVGVTGLSDGASVKCLRGTKSAKCSNGHLKEDYKKEIHLCCNKKELVCPVIPNLNITMKSQELKCWEKKSSGQRRSQKFEIYSCPIETPLYISALLSALPDEPGSRDWKTKMTDIFNGVSGVQKWLNKDKDFWSGLRGPQDWVKKAEDFLKKLSGSHDWLKKLEAAIKNSDPSYEKDDDAHDIDATTTDIADVDDTFNNDDENNEDEATADDDVGDSKDVTNTTDDDDGDDGDSKDVTNTTDDNDGDDEDSKDVTNTTDDDDSDDGDSKDVTNTTDDDDGDDEDSKDVTNTTDDDGRNNNIIITFADGDDDGRNKNITITVADGDDVGDNKEFSTMHVLFPCLALVVILVTCFIFLWLANRKHQRNLEIGGASDQQVLPGKKMESISDSDLRNNELVYIKPSHNYEEIPAPQEDSAEVLQNPLYIPSGHPSQEKQSGSEDKHPAEGQYSLLQLPGQQ